MDGILTLVLLVNTRHQLFDQLLRSEENATQTSCALQEDTRFACPSPLGALYRREHERLSMKYPTLDGTVCDLSIILSFVHLFLDAGVEELAQAMIEGSPDLIARTDGHITTYALSMVRKALALARR